MTKTKLTDCTDKAREETRAALQAVFDALNKGQKQKLLKDETILALMQKFSVQIDEAD